MASRQDGVIGVDQLADIGCGHRQWYCAQRSGRWIAETRRVLRLDGTEHRPGQRVHAALLDAGGGAVLHGPSALAWLGLRGFDLSKIHITRRRGTRTVGAELAVVHRLRDLRPQDLCVVRGVPTVTALRAIWSEASRFSNERWYERGFVRIGRLLDDANRDGLVTWAGLRASVAALQQSGRSGTRLMRALSAERPPGSIPTESRNEDRFESILEASGVEPMLRQCVVGGDAPIGRADFRDPDLPVVAEINSISFHSLPSDQRNDEGRYATMVDAGFAVGVIWESDVWSRPAIVTAVVAEVRRRSRRQDPAVVHSAGCPWPHDPDRIVIDVIEPTTRG
ncbi:hypothetical protein [Actinospongicola halichondriae]|uniref:hypothetical protein n=1 Tax=Actinospongicola halichondriae TaxID=3236844 RepID=UPI003D5305B8